MTDPVEDGAGEVDDADPEVVAGMTRLAELRAEEEQVVDLDTARRRE